MESEKKRSKTMCDVIRRPYTAATETP